MPFYFSKTIKLAVWSYINQALSMVLLLFQVKVLTRFLSVGEFGAWSQINVAVMLVNMMLCLNLGHGFIRFASAYSAYEKQACFGSVLLFQTAMHLLAMVLIWPFRYSIAQFLSGSVSDSIYWAIAVTAVFSMIVVNIQNYLLVTGQEMQMVRQNLIRLVSDVVFTIGGVSLRHDLLGAVWGYAASAAACVILFSWINRINYRKLPYSHAIIKALLKFSVPLMSMSVAYWVISSSNRYLLNYFMGLEAVGQFSVANRLPMMLVVIFTLLSTIFLSNVSRLFDAKNFERVSYWFSLIIKIFLYLGVAGGAALIAGNRTLTLILSNESYIFDGLPLVYLFVVIGSLAFGCFQILSRLYELEKQVYRSSLNWVMAMLLNVGLNIWLIPRYGLVGGAVATGASFSSGFLIGWVFRPRRIVLGLPRFRLLIYALGSLVTAWLYAVKVDGVFVAGIWPSLLVAAGFAGTVMLTGFLMRIVTWQEVMAIIKKA
jgi:O-antigen/teichoic acid export membrane protein